jgi:hypothetical protein
MPVMVHGTGHAGGRDCQEVPSVTCRQKRSIQNTRRGALRLAIRRARGERGAVGTPVAVPIDGAGNAPAMWAGSAVLLPVVPALGSSAA